MGNVIIFGAGKVGRTLLEILEDQNHKLWIVEPNRAVCDELASEKSVSVIHGDSTDPGLLDELEMGKMDYVFSVTDSDEANFLSGMYCKQAGAKKVICRVNSLKHAKLLEKMGIEAVISELTLASELANRLSSPTVHKLLSPAESKMEIVEKDCAEWAGKTVAEAEKRNFAILALYDGKTFKLAKDIGKLPGSGKLVILREKGFRLF